MSKPIAVVAADCHLDHLIWRSRPEIYGDSHYAFKQLVTLAVSRKLPLILAGDIVETLPVDAPNSETISVLRESMAALRRAGIPVYYISGQHDQAKLSWVTACGGARMPPMNSIVEIGGKRFAFIPWLPSRLLPAAMEAVDVERADVVICHQVWQEMMGGESAEGRLSQFKTPSLVISGDYHRQLVKRVHREGLPDLVAVSPGATHMRKLNEPVKHCAAILYDDLDIKWVQLRSRRVLSTELVDEPSYSRLIRGVQAGIDSAIAKAVEMELPSELLTPLLIVRDSSGVTRGEARIREIVGRQAHVFYSRTGALEDDASTQVVETSNRYSLAEFVRDETAGDDEVCRLLLDLLVSQGQPADILGQYKQDYLNGSAAKV
jgi:hypothetical protein